jgi:hypothetical protein
MKARQLAIILILFFSLITATYAGHNKALQKDAEFDAYRALQSTRQIIFNDLRHNVGIMLPFLNTSGTPVFGVDSVDSGAQRHKEVDTSIFASQYRN